MASKAPSLLRRSLSEALAIFIAVAVALAADDWRETRSEREEAIESLVLADLQSDSVEFAEVEDEAGRQAAAAVWLIRNWDRQDNDLDSLETTLYAFSTGTRLQLSRAGFAGLQNANRLRLLESDSIRIGLQRYYQVTQISRSDFF